MKRDCLIWTTGMNPKTMIDDGGGMQRLKYDTKDFVPRILITLQRERDDHLKGIQSAGACMDDDEFAVKFAKEIGQVEGMEMAMETIKEVFARDFSS